ncbi:MAG: hypothetical protein J5545_12180 [Bacteroidaceae bacterium]|nr:hypothetical protein [Bacteroidaceae bacterium]
MKKIYESPTITTIVVVNKLLQQSNLPMNESGGDGEVLVKENNPFVWF